MANFFDQLKDLGYKCRYPPASNLSPDEVSDILKFCADLCSPCGISVVSREVSSLDHAVEVRKAVFRVCLTVGVAE
jgi:hypothetical protein